MNTKKKMIIGFITIMSIITVASLIAYSAVGWTQEDDPTDPGNTSGPGFGDKPEPMAPGMGTEALINPIDTCNFAWI